MDKIAKPLISILVANYNNGAYIREMLDSVLNQQLPESLQIYKCIDIVIVDDCSTDNSIEIINQYIKFHKNQVNIRFFQNEYNLGCGGTKRKCIELAEGDYFIFVDPDDIITPDCLFNLYAQIQTGDYSIVYASHYLCNENLEIQSKSGWVGPIKKGESHFTSTSGHISAPALCRMSYYKKTEGINADYVVCEDQDLYCKMEEIAPVYYIDEALYFYRAHNHNMSRNRQSDLLNSYWKLKFQLDTYNRRKENNFHSNLTHDKIKLIKQQYYSKSFYTHFYQKKYLKSIKYLFLAVVYKCTNKLSV